MISVLLICVSCGNREGNNKGLYLSNLHWTKIDRIWLHPSTHNSSTSIQTTDLSGSLMSRSWTKFKMASSPVLIICQSSSFSPYDSTVDIILPATSLQSVITYILTAKRVSYVQFALCCSSTIKELYFSIKRTKLSHVLLINSQQSPLVDFRNFP